MMVVVVRFVNWESEKRKNEKGMEEG
ncbi:hypothetical protein E2C01_074712 [Portunus trituberculatus]|uniref:Uncharacterized protein n=1 Tax=Portunus trituberculatus TaxID=210409 RepID=A0A5B7ICZ6_PORTR|nr:hypothetical protein [Portunus trituberculatus]